MADITDLYDRLVAQAKRGPRWNPPMHEAVCSVCDEQTQTVRWMGYRYCLNCLPGLPTALMQAPETEPAGIDPEFHSQVWFREQ